MKRSRTKNVARKKTADKNLNVIAEDVHTNREVDIVGIPDSSVIKAHDDIAMDEEEEDDVSFDPPLHSTAVYTDADEPLEKDLHEERPREEQSLSSSVRKGKSRSTSSKSKTAESSEDHTAQENTVIEKTKKKTPNKKKIDTKHGQSAERIDEEEEENVLRRPSQAKKRRKKISEGANKGEVEVEDNSETPGQTKKRRRKVKNATPNKAKYQVQTDVVECSASQDEASNRSQPLGQAKKRRRKSSDEAGSPKSKTPKRMQNTSLTPDSSVSGLTNTVPIKVWRSKEMPRSSRDLNEFDVVLSEFEEIVEEYRDAIDSSACKKAVDMFFNSFKEQLTASIEDSHKLKNLKRQNTKLQLEIGKMRKKLIHVREELIENEPKLKKLQKEYAEQEEQKSCLNKAHSFLDNLKELQNNYMAFKAQHPGTRETYGMSSIAALLQQSETIFRAESHFQNINAKLQSFVDQQKKNDMVSS
ncbi:centromere protein U isoform X3 [Xenopus laevis]|uniref:Centromere protein U n=1 Tax=Xenopus laevis TaxID=8355 RepID=A0A8J1MT28_XENLA|nr:centromere protein U isoform X3 [Xenopus laevis]